MKRTPHLTFAFLFSLGCGAEQDQASPETANGQLAYRGNGTLDLSSIPSTGRVPGGCERIEGGQIGEDGLKVALGAGVTVTFLDWTSKDGEAEEIGFRFVTSGGNVAYAVKAGGETHYGNASPWRHPGGTGGPNAPGISNITLCPERPGEGGSGGAVGSGGSVGSGGAGGSAGPVGTGGSSDGSGGSAGVGGGVIIVD
jgi:hypothetical protein